MNKLIVEFIGTFFLVQAVGYAALTKSALGAVAVGLMPVSYTHLTLPTKA